MALRSFIVANEFGVIVYNAGCISDNMTAVHADEYLPMKS
jgi:hypothetical protein